MEYYCLLIQYSKRQWMNVMLFLHFIFLNPQSGILVLNLDCIHLVNVQIVSIEGSRLKNFLFSQHGLVIVTI